MNNTIVLKLGGSLIYDSELQLQHTFLKKFKDWFERSQKEYRRIVVIVGGGKMSRHLVDQVKHHYSNERDLHRIGMSITNSNAEVLRAILNNDQIQIPKSFGQVLELAVEDNSKYVISGGFKEGWSTDMDAAVLAHVMGVKKVHKLSNIDHVYSADPATNPDARMIKDMSWEQFFIQFGISRDLIKHAPGLNTPIGAHAANFAAQKGLSFMFSGGATIESESRLENVLQTGTLIHP